MLTQSKLFSAVLFALALGASSAYAKHGADDVQPQPCDDHGTDVCNMQQPVNLAKHGADDAVDPFDDNGVDLVIAKHGADDLIDGFDDNGVDPIAG